MKLSRKELDATRQIERSTLAFELLRFCAQTYHFAQVEQLPCPFQSGMVAAPTALLNKLRRDATPENEEKLPANAAELSKQLLALKNALEYHGVALHQIRVEGNRRWKIFYSPPPPKIIESIPARELKPSTRSRARARAKKEIFDTSPTLIEEAEKLSAREAEHVPELWIVSAPIKNSTARTPYVLCPQCRQPRRALYRVDAGQQWICRECGNFKYSSRVWPKKPRPPQP